MLTALTDEARTHILKGNMIPLLSEKLRRDNVQMKSTAADILKELAKYGA